MRTVVLRVVALAMLLLLALIATLSIRTLQRLPDVTLYFVRSDATSFTLEPVHRRLHASEARRAVTTDATAATVWAALEALTDGPSGEEAQRGLGSEVPPATRVHGVRLDDGVLTVDLSADFTVGGGTASMLGRLYQVQYTAARPGAVEAVRLLVDGDPLVALGGEGLMVDQPWRPPTEGLPRW